MKKGLILMVCMAALTSCKLDLKNWESHTIEASSKIITKTFKVQPFKMITMSSIGVVELIQSDTKDGVIELTAPENYIDLYKIKSNEGKLDIGFSRDNINIQSKHLHFKVYTNNLIKIENRGAASIKMDSLDTDVLEVENSGVGSIAIAGIADDVKLENSGVGSINAVDMKALNVKANVSGVGSIKCYASEKIEGKVSGVGSLKYAGHPKKKYNKRTGVGSISEL